MEVAEINQEALGIISALTKQENINIKMTLGELIQDSLTLMKVIVAIENKFDIYLDDINFIELYNYTVKDFIGYAKIGQGL